MDPPAGCDSPEPDRPAQDGYRGRRGHGPHRLSNRAGQRACDDSGRPRVRSATPPDAGSIRPARTGRVSRQHVERGAASVAQHGAGRVALPGQFGYMGRHRTGMAGPMSGPPESVVFVAPGVMGGVVSIIANLLAYREPDAFTYHVVLTREARSTDARFTGRLAADTQRVVPVSLGIENLHAVIRRVSRALPPGGGVLVTNDLVELATVSALDVNRTVMMLIHGDDPYYYDLAARHEDVIDVFICYGQVMFDTLRQRLPGRHASILHLPYGIPLPARTRTAARGPLR